MLHIAEDSRNCLKQLYKRRLKSIEYISTPYGVTKRVVKEKKEIKKQQETSKFVIYD